MEQVLGSILGLGGMAAYVVIALLAFGESAAFVGLVLPGEIALVLGGVLASQGRASLPLMLVFAATAVIAGDSAGYEMGRRWGPRLLRSPAARRHADTISATEGYLRDRGALMVVLGRWTSVLRAIVPAVAGITRMPYPRFFAFNVIGGTTWATAFTVAGYAAGESYGVIESATGWGSWIVVGGLVIWLTARWIVRHRGRARIRVHGSDGTAAAPRTGCADPSATTSHPEAA